MNKNDTKLYKLTYLLKIVMLGVVIVKLTGVFGQTDIARFFLCLASIPVVIVPDIIRQYTHIKIDQKVDFTYSIFIFVSLILGSIYNFYAIFPGFDKFAHTFSGVLTAALAMLILWHFKINTDKNQGFSIIFINVFSLAVAGLWEIFEFIVSQIFNNDIQYVATTGVTDTMMDMIVATIGSIIFTYWLLAAQKNPLGVKKSN